MVEIIDGSPQEPAVIEARRLQRSFGDGLIAEEIEDLRETWMRHVDVVLQDDTIVSAVYQALRTAIATAAAMAGWVFLLMSCCVC